MDVLDRFASGSRFAIALEIYGVTHYTEQCQLFHLVRLPFVFSNDKENVKCIVSGTDK